MTDAHCLGGLKCDPCPFSFASIATETKQITFLCLPCCRVTSRARPVAPSADCMATCAHFNPTESKLCWGDLKGIAGRARCLSPCSIATGGIPGQVSCSHQHRNLTHSTQLSPQAGERARECAAGDRQHLSHIYDFEVTTLLYNPASVTTERLTLPQEDNSTTGG